MKRIIGLLNILKPAVLFALIGGTVALTPHLAQARDQVPFRAEWEVGIEATINFPIATIIGFGEGRASHLGRITAESIAEEVNLVTGAGEAEYRFTAANGDELLIHFVFTAIPTSATGFAISGAWQFTGGTGRFSDASGAGAYQGTVEFTGPDTAQGHFIMRGTISSPGSLKK